MLECQTVDRTLILPLAILDPATSEAESYLSRQIPILLRNQFNRLAPDEFLASPLAMDADQGRAWVMTSECMRDETALTLARRQKANHVVFGALGGPPRGGRHGGASAPRVLFLRGLDVESGRATFERTFSGDLLRVLRCALKVLVQSSPSRFESVADRFRPGTHNVEAFEQFLLGLDVLLAIRTQGIELPDLQALFDPFHRALNLDPCYADALTGGLTCAMLFVKTEGRELSLDPALAALTVWAEDHPEDHRVPAVHSELLVRRGRHVEAYDLVRRALDTQFSWDIDLMKRRGELELRLGRNEEALVSLEACLEKSDDPEIRVKCAAAASAAGMVERSREHLLWLLDSETQDAGLWCRLALLEKRSKDLPAMWRAFARMFDSHTAPTCGELTKLTVTLAEAPPPPEFVASLRRWYPPHDFDSAQRLFFARALRMGGAVMESRLCLQTSKLADLKDDEALMWRRERLNLDLAGFDARFEELALALSNAGDPRPQDGAFLQDALKLEEEFWPARFLLALWHARQGGCALAIRELDRVIKQRPTSDLAWYTRGIQCLKLDRIQQARASLERAILLNAEEAEYHCHLALCLLRLEGQAPALRALARARQLRPEHPDNERVQSQIEAMG
ncbi:MAG: tetratricopeptide repeat protein [Planctomycetota bacterium]